MEIVVLLFAILSVIVAFFAGTKGRTRFGWFWVSFLLSPVIGLILVAILPAKTNQSDIALISPTRDKLIELKKLIDEGLINEEEYAARRKIILESTDS